jgi:hypothetical protein
MDRLRDQPLAESSIWFEGIGDDVRCAVVLTAVQDAESLLFRQAIHFRKQCLAFGRARIHEQVDKNGASRARFARGEGLDAVVTDQIDQLESFVKGHAASMISRRGAITPSGRSQARRRCRGAVD